MMTPRDHGGGLDAAIAKWGGSRNTWMDLSTGINPVPYPVGDIDPMAWTALPDKTAQNGLISAARSFWNVPDSAEIFAAPGASALIARMPELSNERRVYIPAPTYNEHAAAFRAHGWEVVDDPTTPVAVFVHPNNPTGRYWTTDEVTAPRALTIIDESFADIAPDQTHIALTEAPGTIVLKSFGKFWGLAGMRLGFAIAQKQTLGRPDHAPTHQTDLAEIMGPWAVSGPALQIGTEALRDQEWAQNTRRDLTLMAAKLDQIFAPLAMSATGTSLFRLYEVKDAKAVQNALAQNHIWTRIFPYSDTLLRVGLPHPNDFDRLATVVAALETTP